MSPETQSRCVREVLPIEVAAVTAARQPALVRGCDIRRSSHPALPSHILTTTLRPAHLTHSCTSTGSTSSLPPTVPASLHKPCLHSCALPLHSVGRRQPATRPPDSYAKALTRLYSCASIKPSATSSLSHLHRIWEPSSRLALLQSSAAPPRSPFDRPHAERQTMISPLASAIQSASWA